jgi:limonene-1,2-epoxide hydrolase
VGTPSEVVRGFLAAIEAKDVDAALDFLADDVSYENMPMDPIVGKVATDAVLRSFLEPAAAVEWRILREVVIDELVVNERLDRFRIGDDWLELPIAGFFEINDQGLIRRWRDYFDMGSYTRQLAALTGGG